MFTTLTQEWGFTTTLQQQKVSKNMSLRGLNYSHSIVDGGFEDISNVTLEIPETSLMIRVDT